MNNLFLCDTKKLLTRLLCSEIKSRVFAMEKKCDYNQEKGTEKTEFHTLEEWERCNENYMEKENT